MVFHELSQLSARCISFNRLLFIFVLFLCTIDLSRSDCTLLKTSEGQARRKRKEELLKTIQPLQEFEFATNDGVGEAKYSYKVRICATVKGENANVGAVQLDVKSEKKILGLYNVSEITGGTDWVMLTYNNGSLHTQHCSGVPRIAHIMIICDPDHVQGELRILEEKVWLKDSNCFYLFELSSSVVCSRESSHGLSSGGVFCVIFFTFVGTYFLLGFFYQRLVAGAKGLEQIPHYSFWRSFGNLQADGCDYVCRCGPRQESQAYRGIDDRLKTEDERDEQLLN